MDTEDRIVDDGSDREIVEEVCEKGPNCGRTEFALTFCIETIDLGYLTGLVIAS